MSKLMLVLCEEEGEYFGAGESKLVLLLLLLVLLVLKRERMRERMLVLVSQLLVLLLFMLSSSSQSPMVEELVRGVSDKARVKVMKKTVEAMLKLFHGAVECIDDEDGSDVDELERNASSSPKRVLRSGI